MKNSNATEVALKNFYMIICSKLCGIQNELPFENMSDYEKGVYHGLEMAKSEALKTLATVSGKIMCDSCGKLIPANSLNKYCDYCR